MKVIDFRICSNICSRLLYCEFVGFEVLSDVHAQYFLIRICFVVRIIGATDVDKHLCEQITKILWIWNLVVNSVQREGAARQSRKVAEFYACRATPCGATKLLCRAIGSGATKGSCHATKWKNAVLTGLGHTMARQRASVAPVVLARQAYSVCTTTACTGACTTTVLALTCWPRWSAPI